MTANLPEVLAKADLDMLKEILREAESYLGAQLTVGLASNQRAMTFATTLSAATAVIGSAAGALLLRSPPHLALGAVCVIVAFGFLSAVWNSMKAAAPIAFAYVGNVPAGWVRDVEGGVTLVQSLAEQCAFYDEKIGENRARLERSNTQLELAMQVVFRTMIVGGAVALIVVVLELHRSGAF